MVLARNLDRLAGCTTLRAVAELAINLRLPIAKKLNGSGYISSSRTLLDKLPDIANKLEFLKAIVEEEIHNQEFDDFFSETPKPSKLTKSRKKKTLKKRAYTQSSGSQAQSESSGYQGSSDSDPGSYSFTSSSQSQTSSSQTQPRKKNKPATQQEIQDFIQKFMPKH